jgi:DNA repair exonuclease SbcCD ATPase subunit
MPSGIGADTAPVTPESRAEIDARLKELEAEEQALSASRRRLHDRLALYPELGGADLEEKERELSARRRELHAEIDTLRASRHNGAAGV